MILYEGGEDIPTRKYNSSEVYCTGSVHITSYYGKVTVVGQESRYYLTATRAESHKYFIVQFEDGTKVQAMATNIKNGKVKNPNKPSLHNVGILGQGDFSYKTHHKEYSLWNGMLKRCYSKDYQMKHPTYKNCSSSDRWRYFQLFCVDIQLLKGYNEWKKDKSTRSKYELDKDIIIKGNKLYSRNTCMFVLYKDNLKRHNKKQTLTGLTYLATRTSDGHTEEFVNQSEFSDKYSLTRRYVCSCCNGELESTGGWTFEVKGNS
jgi:hypothetical protein